MRLLSASVPNSRAVFLPRAPADAGQMRRSRCVPPRWLVGAQAAGSRRSRLAASVRSASAVSVAQGAGRGGRGRARACAPPPRSPWRGCRSCGRGAVSMRSTSAAPGARFLRHGGRGRGEHRSISAACCGSSPLPTVEAVVKRALDLGGSRGSPRGRGRGDASSVRSTSAASWRRRRSRGRLVVSDALDVAASWLVPADVSTRWWLSTYASAFDVLCTVRHRYRTVTVAASECCSTSLRAVSGGR